MYNLIVGIHILLEESSICGLRALQIKIKNVTQPPFLEFLSGRNHANIIINYFSSLSR